MIKGNSPAGPDSPASVPIERKNWLARLDEHGEIHGFHRQLGPSHGALFTEDDDILLVSFEPAGRMRASQTGLPWALGAAGREGWSQLCLYSEGTTFFRSQAVYSFFDELIDDGFFDRFEQVVFYGAGPCGYGAAAYSVAAPGSTVVLVRPLATLDPARTEWDRRHPKLRRTDFRERFGYAPDMLEGAERAFVIYDPEVPEDAMHATLFDRPNCHRLRCRLMGPTPERELAAMGVLESMLRAAGRGKLVPATFHELYRRRRHFPAYLRRVLTRLRARQRTGLMRHWTQGIRAVGITHEDGQPAG